MMFKRPGSGPVSLLKQVSDDDMAFPLHVNYSAIMPSYKTEWSGNHFHECFRLQPALFLRMSSHLPQF